MQHSRNKSLVSKSARASCCPRTGVERVLEVEAQVHAGALGDALLVRGGLDVAEDEAEEYEL
jgi:hypothetical protein